MNLKFRSSAFRRGLAMGFAAPYRLMLQGSWHPSYRQTDTIGDAWREIGTLLNEEIRNEGKKLGEQSRRKEKPKRERRIVERHAS